MATALLSERIKKFIKYLKILLAHFNLYFFAARLGCKIWLLTNCNFYDNPATTECGAIYVS